MASSGNRPTMSLRPYEKQGQSLQNKEITTHHYLEAVWQPMAKPSTGFKCNGHFPRKNTCQGSRSRRFPPRRKPVRTAHGRKPGRRIPKGTRPKGRTKESPHMLLLRKARSLCTRLPTETKQPGTKWSPSQYSNTHACSANPTGRKQHSGS
jgi:hypothetical protein